MLISQLDESNETIVVDTPLTTTSGKARVKQRDSIFGYGSPFASRKHLFNQKNYVEWQVVMMPYEWSRDKNREAKQEKANKTRYF